MPMFKVIKSTKNWCPLFYTDDMHFKLIKSMQKLMRISLQMIPLVIIQVFDHGIIISKQCKSNIFFVVYLVRIQFYFNDYNFIDILEIS